MLKATPLACLPLVALMLNAQTFNATLTGRAIDPSGAVVPRVQVVLKSAATGVLQTTATTADGVYTFPLIPPGRYTLTAHVEGFAPVEITDIVLQVGARIGFDIELSVSTSSASVQVTADAGSLQLKTESGERSDVITNRQIRDLALNGRNILDLMNVSPPRENEPGDDAAHPDTIAHHRWCLRPRVLPTYARASHCRVSGESARVDLSING